MEQYIEKKDVQNYLILPKTFDWDLIDQEIGFNKIFEIFSLELYSSMKDNGDEVYKEIFKELTKAGVYYSFILSIPKLKVHISNYGLQEFNQPKVKSSPWWDIRDLGLSMLKIADKCLSDAIEKAYGIEELRSRISWFSSVTDYLPTPAAFEKIYSINYSPEVFSMLQKFINKALISKVNDKIKPDCLVGVQENESLLPFLKDALAFYALYYASLLPGFVFTQNAVAIQYDELPWQKSLVLDAHAKLLSGQNFLQLADESLKIITDYIKSNIENFPCYEPAKANRKLESRPSGIFL